MVVSIVHLEGILKFCIEENQLEVTHMDPVFLEKKEKQKVCGLERVLQYPAYACWLWLT